SYRLRVTHLGYGPREETIQVPLRLDALVIRLTPAAVPLEAIVVTGSRRPQRLADTPVLTEMIGSRVIENAASADLSQLLLEQLGIQMEGGPASGEGLMLQ